MTVGIVDQGVKSNRESVVYAMLNLATVSEGSIKIDNIKVDEVGHRMLRKSIMWIPENPTLFSGTVRDNFDSRREFSYESIMKIVNDLGLKYKIDTLPHGIDTEVDEVLFNKG